MEQKREIEIRIIASNENDGRTDEKEKNGKRAVRGVYSVIFRE